MTKRITLLTVAIAASLLAQQPPGGPGQRRMQPRYDTIKAHLNLTDSQLQALQQIQQQQMDTVRPMMQQIGQKHGALNDLIQKGGADPAAVGKLVLEIDALQKSIAQKQTSFADQARNSLTADQKAKLKALDDVRQAMPALDEGAALNLLPPVHHSGGPGMMGMPGQGPAGFVMDGFRGPRPSGRPPRPPQPN